MGKDKMRTCVVCGKKYSFCPVCDPKDAKLEPWHFAWCSEDCKEIYGVTSAFEDGRMSAIEAEEKLEKLDLSRIEYFGTSYKDSIAKINDEVLFELNVSDNEDDK